MKADRFWYFWPGFLLLPLRVETFEDMVDVWGIEGVDGLMGDGDAGDG